MTNDQDYDEDGNNIVPCPICLDVYCPGNQFDRNGNKIGDGKCPKEDEFARDMTTPTTPQEDRGIMLANDWLEMQDTTTKAIVATLLSQERTRTLAKVEEWVKARPFFALTDLKTDLLHHLQQLKDNSK